MKNKEKEPVNKAEKSKKKMRKRKILMAAVATIASAAVIVGTLLPSAQEVVSPNMIASPPPIVLDIEEDAIAENEDAGSETKKSNRFEDRLRDRLLSLPQAIRVIFILPLWALGAVITSFGSLLWGGLFSPVLSFVASWVLSMLAIIAVFAFSAKLLFPNIPFRKILAKKNIVPLMVVSFLVIVMDAVLPFYFEGYNAFSWVFKIGIPFGLVILLIHRLKTSHTTIFS